VVPALDKAPRIAILLEASEDAATADYAWLVFDHGVGSDDRCARMSRRTGELHRRQIQATPTEDTLIDTVSAACGCAAPTAVGRAFPVTMTTSAGRARRTDFAFRRRNRGRGPISWWMPTAYCIAHGAHPNSFVEDMFRGSDSSPTSGSLDQAFETSNGFVPAKSRRRAFTSHVVQFGHKDFRRQQRR